MNDRTIPQFTQENGDRLNQNITMQEISQATKKMKKDKTPDLGWTNSNEL